MESGKILLVDKPVNWTSFDVVAKIRGLIKKSYLDRGEKPTKRQLKVGHAGTLDPFATGLLIILLGDATKHAGEFLKLDKVYEATICLGATSTTGDPEGIITETERRRDGETERIGESDNAADVANSIITPTEKVVRKVLVDFTGTVTQIPPQYSAIKVGGVRAYDAARKGKAVDIPPRQVTVYSLDLLDYAYPELHICAHVSSGTYIRTLAEDIGTALGTGAYCSQLRRTQVGEYSVDNATQVTEVNIDKL